MPIRRSWLPRLSGPWVALVAGPGRATGRPRCGCGHADDGGLVGESLDQFLERRRRDDVVLTEPQPDVVAVDLDVLTGQPGDAGGGLARNRSRRRAATRSRVARVSSVTAQRGELPPLVIGDQPHRTTRSWPRRVEIADETPFPGPA